LLAVPLPPGLGAGLLAVLGACGGSTQPAATATPPCAAAAAPQCGGVAGVAVAAATSAAVSSSGVVLVSFGVVIQCVCKSVKILFRLWLQKIVPSYKHIDLVRVLTTFNAQLEYIHKNIIIIIYFKILQLYVYNFENIKFLIKSYFS
jgi:hypothetical protein